MANRHMKSFPRRLNIRGMHGLPWWQLVKNPACNAGDMGLIHDQRTEPPDAAGYLSPCDASTDLHTLEPAHHNGRAALTLRQRADAVKYM